MKHSVTPIRRGTTPGATGNSTATTTANHYPGPGSDSPAWTSIKGAGAWTRYITDTTGAFTINLDTDSHGQPASSTLQLSNPHGDLAATIPNTTNPTPSDLKPQTNYTPHGQPTNPTQTPHPYGWEGTNQRNNTNPSGLITMGARTYNPTTGRFLQTDPIPGGNQNPYTYPVDPINQQDLNGEASSNMAFACREAGLLAYGKCLYLTNRVRSYVEDAGRNEHDRNAMRHVMVSMILSWAFGHSMARNILRANEDGSEDYLDRIADIQNNRIGLRAANRLRAAASQNDLNWRIDTAKAVYDRKRYAGKVWCAPTYKELQKGITWIWQCAP